MSDDKIIGYGNIKIVLDADNVQAALKSLCDRVFQNMKDTEAVTEAAFSNISTGAGNLWGKVTAGLIGFSNDVSHTVVRTWDNFTFEMNKAVGASKTMWDYMGELGKGFGNDIDGSMKSVFEDAFAGHMNTAAYYAGKLKDAMLKSFADMLAGWAAAQVTQTILGGMSSLWKSLSDTTMATADGTAAGTAYATAYNAASSGLMLVAGGAAASLTASQGGQAISQATGVNSDMGQVLANPIGAQINWVSNALGIKFADGGIMTSLGALPLNPYAGGGIANSPQVAVFGEGRMNEAYVPLPDGRSIPVTMSGGQSQQSQGGDVILMLDGQVLGKILNGMSRQGRLKLDPMVLQSAAMI